MLNRWLFEKEFREFLRDVKELGPDEIDWTDVSTEWETYGKEFIRRYVGKFVDKAGTYCVTESNYHFTVE